jgi:hypothetical protein
MRKVQDRATSADDEQRALGALFYFFLVGVDERPHVPAVLTTENAELRVGEVITLVDGSRVRIRAINPPADDETVGLDGVLVVEPYG